MRREIENVIEVKQLSKKLGSFTLGEMSFELPMGYIIGLIGENGAGKTTLLHLLLGLYQPDSGQVNVLGENYADREADIRQEIGWVLQERLFADNDSLLENADVYGAYYENYDRELLMAYLEEFGLSPQKKYRKLSKGEELKFQFAFALSHKPRLLLLDEATGNFDPKFRERFLVYIKEFIKDGDRSVLLATHLTQELEQIADYILYMEKGRLLLNYDIETLRSRYRVVTGEDYKLKLLPKDKVICMEKGKLSTRALIRYRRHFTYDKELTLTVPTIEEIMYFITKRERGWEYEF
ncbi:MAG: ABC transporter ATP-binding protein [Lachnospiraceae bacterium]|nr:ABC transporter ATP-binding protein [Lachnospiraceae bacterium]